MSAADHEERHVVAEVAGLKRYMRSVTADLLTRILVAFLVVGGLVVALTAGSHSGRATGAAALLCVGVALGAAFLVVMRYLGVVRRLDGDPEEEVTRLTARPGRRLRQFLDGAGVAARTPAGGISDDPIETVGDPYVEMRDVGFGPDTGPNGVNRSDDPRRGPIE